jgi:hypothetical protein
MTMQNLKEKVLEFAEIAKHCPENLQEKCFELLLSDFLSQQSPKSKTKKEKPEFDEEEKVTDGGEKKTESKQEDIQDKDLHVKVRQFLKKETVTVGQINQIFYQENGDLKPLYDDLKTTKAAESQIRIALLTALKNAINTGDFQFNGEDIRKETQTRKCYDAPNFAANFKKNKMLFDSFEAYDKSNPTISLSTEGKTRLAEIIKDLQ